LPNEVTNGLINEQGQKLSKKRQYVIIFFVDEDAAAALDFYSLENQKK
jgi:hypothetical protein